MPELQIRPQLPADLPLIEAVNAAAFADHGGTAAFDRFREERDDIISLVATLDGQVVGHVLFSPVVMETPDGKVEGMGLGQLAVNPEHQNQGVGTKLSEHGISQLRKASCPFIIVIGHAAYYPRFGFLPAGERGFSAPYPIPEEHAEAWMVVELASSSTSSA